MTVLSTAMTNLMPAPWFQGRNLLIRIGSLPQAPLRARADPGEHMLGCFILPPFRRLSGWSEEQRIALVESLWDGLPIGTIVHNAAPGGMTDCWLLDGRNRVNAILEYFADAFPVYGYRWSDLQMHERRAFEARSISALECRITDPDLCRRVHQRITPAAPQTNGF